ncbi:MAG: hypothetical protein QOC61_1466 [Acidobacteriota bacterium]|jgi:hypothetical protein|nr:hypothetical protein [Acidobacteriota bacterium]MDT5262462.1 hypothetical protein [Acidobacteriota bacterium]
MKLSKLLGRLFGAGHPTGARVVGGDYTGTEAEEEVGGVDPFDPFPEPVRLEIGDVFDLHSIPPAEVRAVVEEYLREARRAGFPFVRIIHGKGVGVQRETVRSILARTPFVEHFTDAPESAGGWGATIAYLTHD